MPKSRSGKHRKAPNEVISALAAQGYPVIAAANPLRGVHGDSAALASLLAGIDGPLVLVGHS
jgi:hypothetical protein